MKVTELLAILATKTEDASEYLLTIEDENGWYDVADFKWNDDTQELVFILGEEVEYEESETDQEGVVTVTRVANSESETENRSPETDIEDATTE